MLDDEILDKFIHRFYGYGNYQGKYWFIGMEEGGGNSYEEISQRLFAWDNRGVQELEDVAAFHHAINIDYLFDDHPKIQPTWNKLIRIVLNAESLICDTQTVRDYQRDKLGRPDGDTCLLELYPLPSPGLTHWLYGSHSSLSYLKDRDSYKNHVRHERISHLREKISNYHPPIVIFYGFGYEENWEWIAERQIKTEIDSKLGFYSSSTLQTLFIIVKHPATMGVTNEYFHNIGNFIRKTKIKSG
jgi:hypothetical protein